MRLPVPRWFPPLSRTHPAFFLSYTFTLLINLAMALGYLLAPDTFHDAPGLSLVNRVADIFWIFGAVLVTALLFIGYHPRRFQWGRAGFAIGFTIWFTRAWLILCAVLFQHETATPVAIAAYAYIGLMHIPQGLEPPINPQTWDRARL